MSEHIKKLLANGCLIPRWSNNLVLNYYSTKSKKQQEQGGKNNPAFNICIIYFMGIYSSRNHQIVVSILSLSGNGALNDSLDCSRHSPEVYNMKRKATSFHFEWRWSLFLKGGCKLKALPFKTRFQIQKYLDSQSTRPCHILRNTSSSTAQPGTQEWGRQDETELL